jgi:hypothetical protein
MSVRSRQQIRFLVNGVSGRRGEHPLLDNEVFLREQDCPATQASFPCIMTATESLIPSAIRIAWQRPGG